MVMRSMRPPRKVFPLSVSGDNIAYDIRAAAVSAGWNQTDVLNIILTINAGAVLHAGFNPFGRFSGLYTSLSGTFPTGTTITILNKGSIYGSGGNGGQGQGPGAGAGAPGGGGGPAIFLNWNVIIDTSAGQIYGGGGGGGGGGGSTSGTAAGTGGGGGGGQGDLGSGGPSNGNAGADGNESGPGVGGPGKPDSFFGVAFGGNGARGGTWGQAAANGGNGDDGSLGGAGGAAGKAIQLNGFTANVIGGNDGPNGTHIKGAIA